jgi:hypothetical protein
VHLSALMCNTFCMCLSWVVALMKCRAYEMKYISIV